jgi:hypothetical protein
LRAALTYGSPSWTARSTVTSGVFGTDVP